MEIILLKNFKNLGQFGQIIKVCSGYARNYLIPKEIALIATKHNIKKLKNFQHKITKYEKVEVLQAQLQVCEIKKLGIIKIFSKSGKKNKLFGSINKKNVIDKIISLGVKIKKNDIYIQNNIIKSLGKYNIVFQPHNEVSCYISLHVISK